MRFIDGRRERQGTFTYSSSYSKIFSNIKKTYRGNVFLHTKLQKTQTNKNKKDKRKFIQFLSVWQVVVHYSENLSLLKIPFEWQIQLALENENR